MDRIVECESAAGKSDPVGVVQDLGALQVRGHAAGIAEVEESGADTVCEGTRPVGMVGEGPHARTLGKQPAGYVPPGVPESAGHDA